MSQRQAAPREDSVDRVVGHLRADPDAREGVERIAAAYPRSDLGAVARVALAMADGTDPAPADVRVVVDADDPASLLRGVRLE